MAPGLIRSDIRGRVLVPSRQREALLDAFEQSGISAMAFCRQHDLKYPTFATWVQKRRRQPHPVSPTFAEVLVGPLPTPPPAAMEPLRITLPGGTRIEIADREQLPWVIELLRALGSRLPC
jgi:hypothetical protein